MHYFTWKLELLPNILWRVVDLIWINLARWRNKLCKSDQKRRQTISKNVDDKAKQYLKKVFKPAKKRMKTIHENLDNEAVSKSRSL